MRVLLDSCIWRGVAPVLEAAGHDVTWVGNWPVDPADAAILATARLEGRVVITLDKDFGELAIVHHRRHAGIVRLVDISARRQATVCLDALQTYGPILSSGAIITAELGRFRVRPAEPAADKNGP